MECFGESVFGAMFGAADAPVYTIVFFYVCCCRCAFDTDTYTHAPEHTFTHTHTYTLLRRAQRICDTGSGGTLKSSHASVHHSHRLLKCICNSIQIRIACVEVLLALRSFVPHAHPARNIVYTTLIYNVVYYVCDVHFVRAPIHTTGTTSWP